MENIINAYFYIAVGATAIFVVKMFIFAIFGGDAEVSTDFSDSFETDTSFDFLSIQSVLAFLMGFGWSGLACLQGLELRIRYTILISLIVGFLMMYFSAWLMCSIKKLNYIVKKDYSKCVGIKGRSYTSFAPHSKGQIEINFNDQLSIEEAINDSDNEINSFTNIKVTKYENGILYIVQD